MASALMVAGPEGAHLRVVAVKLLSGIEPWGPLAAGVTGGGVGAYLHFREGEEDARSETDPDGVDDD